MSAGASYPDLPAAALDFNLLAKLLAEDAAERMASVVVASLSVLRDPDVREDVPTEIIVAGEAIVQHAIREGEDLERGFGQIINNEIAEALGRVHADQNGGLTEPPFGDEET